MGHEVGIVKVQYLSSSKDLGKVVPEALGAAGGPDAFQKLWDASQGGTLEETAPQKIRTTYLLKKSSVLQGPRSSGGERLDRTPIVL